MRRLSKRAGIAKSISPHTLRHAFITAAWMPASHCATCKKLPTPIRGQPCATTGARATLDRRATYIVAAYLVAAYLVAAYLVAAYLVAAYLVAAAR